LLEGAKATTETVDALRNGAVVMKSMQKAMWVDFIYCFATRKRKLHKLEGKMVYGPFTLAH
jgi:hypothetical protein